MTLFSTFAALAMAAVLLRAGLEKVRNLTALETTVRSLGFPQRLAWIGTLFVTGAEITLATSLIFRPDSAVTQFGIGFLAVLFALAGIVAVSLDKPVYCSCFGAGGQGYLGWRQAALLPVWLAGTAVLRFGFQETPSLEMSAAYFAALSLSLAFARALHVMKARSEARGDRLSAKEMYLWLPSH